MLKVKVQTIKLQPKIKRNEFINALGRVNEANSNWT